jgi:predicted lipid-binding transport protein (Tim44 family)
MEHKSRTLILIALVAFVIWLIIRKISPTQSANSANAIDNQSAATPYGNIYVSNELNPIQLPAPNPIYQAYYMTSPGIPDVVTTFNINASDLNYGYIPLFGFVPTPSTT